MKQHKTILIVEDEKNVREELKYALHFKKYRTLEAQDGREGIDIALSSHPDLILLDLIMPEMHGMTALKQIREDKWGRNVPVIIYTNHNPNTEQLIKDIVTHKPHEYLIKADWKIHDVVKKIEKILET